MSRTITRKSDVPRYIPIGPDAASKILSDAGRLPPVSLIVTPLEGQNRVRFDRFLSYKFSSAITIPVDTFQFTAVAPDDAQSFDNVVKSGDIVSLFVNDQPLSTGIIDSVSIETDSQFGEKIEISGRDLMSQYEEQDAVSIDNKPIWGDRFTLRSVIQTLNQNTRFPSDILLRNTPNLGGLLFATEPGETKLSALQRFLEPLNLLAWTDPAGRIVIGRPSMKAAESRGTFIVSKERRFSNVLDIKVTRSTATIPNIIVPIFPVQEASQFVTTTQQQVNNTLSGPERLRKLGHRLPKTTIINHPQGASAQDFSEANRINRNPDFKSLVRAYADRELARYNMGDMLVQVVVPRHINDNGEPFQPDQCYKIEYDRGNVDEVMYLYQVEYDLTEDRAQTTSLFFCRLGTIVAGVPTK